MNIESKQILSEEIVDAEKRLYAAQLISDAEVLDQLLYDKLIALTPAGDLVTKKMDLDSHRDKTMIIEHATSQVEQIEIVGDTAFTIIAMSAKGLMLGNPVEGQFRYLRVWKKLDGSLKVICASIIKLPD